LPASYARAITSAPWAAPKHRSVPPDWRTASSWCQQPSAPSPTLVRARARTAYRARRATAPANVAVASFRLWCGIRPACPKIRTRRLPSGPCEVYRRSTKGQSPRTGSTQGKPYHPDVRVSGTRVVSFRCPRTRRRVYPAASLAGEITGRICRLGTWPPPCLLHVCSAVAVRSGSARYEAAAKWAESRTKRHRQALSGSGRTRNSALLIRGFGVQVPGGAPVEVFAFQ
jgi:hypothetical protein